MKTELSDYNLLDFRSIWYSAKPSYLKHWLISARDDYLCNCYHDYDLASWNTIKKTRQCKIYPSQRRIIGDW